jgi:hypothetical protein
MHDIKSATANAALRFYLAVLTDWFVSTVIRSPTPPLWSRPRLSSDSNPTPPVTNECATANRHVSPEARAESAQ